MNYSLLTKVFLTLASIIGFYVGGSLVFSPAELQAQSGILLGDNASHFSETRAPGAAILSTSFILIIGAFNSRFTRLALILSSLFFLSYGLGRLLSLVLDGMPAEGLFYAMVGELIIGIIAIALLGKTKNE